MAREQYAFCTQRTPCVREIRQINPPFLLMFVGMGFETESVDIITSARVTLEVLAIHLVGYLKAIGMGTIGRTLDMSWDRTERQVPSSNWMICACLSWDWVGSNGMSITVPDFIILDVGSNFSTIVPGGNGSSMAAFESR